MEPLKPAERQTILSNNPDVRKEEIDEYQQLQAARTMHRSHPKHAELVEAAAIDSSEERFRELHRKLFGTDEGPQK